MNGVVTQASVFCGGIPALRAGHEAAEELQEFRQTIPIPVGATDFRPETISGVRCLVSTALHPRCRIIHMHGGGYVCGSPTHYGEFATRLARVIGAEVWVPDYSLAPENPFPAAIHEMMSVVNALVSDPTCLPVFLSGDSAGGGLALTLASIMRRPVPIAGILLLSPWLDLTISSDGFSRCATSDPMFSKEAAENAARCYLQGEDPAHPLASPLFADLSGLPAVTILVASQEVLAEDSLALVARLLAEGVHFQLVAAPEVSHIWPVLEPHLLPSVHAIQILDHAVSMALDRHER
ncbi:acetyl esterase/lipase [Sphingobium xenophagum]|uniref:Acetyl esterase/lipase n=1 Tax=Sphingobium xenophagum TaxID=121428 RepID=A0ABU1X6V0_SPHXE|nr:alpha/beta hydrolase [Sphingobium xenophagum]MDR7157308.1 acetyl esterase/lipase [Sphingobium xenophagum]